MSAVAIQRQGACPCGSRAAAATCCLPREEAFQDLVARALAFAEAPAVRREAAEAAELFWGAEDPDKMADRPDAGLRFLEWLLHDAAPRDGRGPFLGEFADGADLNPPEAAILLGMLLAPVRAYEVTESPTPRGVDVKDLLSGGERRLLPFGMGRLPIRSDLLVCRLVPFGRASRIGAGALRLPAASREELSAYLRMVYRASRAPRHVSLEDFLDGAPHLYHHYFLAHAARAGAEAWQTVRGAVCAPGRLVYRVADAVRLRASLSRQPEIRPEAAGTAGPQRFCWIDPVWGTVRARLELAGDALAVRTAYRSDHAAAAEFLGRILQGLAALLSTEPPPAEPPPPPPLAGGRGGQFLRRAILAWPDTPAAGLGDRTPREAAGQRSERRTVASLLADLERDLARQRRLGRAWMDVSELWDALGIADLAPARAVARPVRAKTPRPAPRPGTRGKGPGQRSAGRRTPR